jgi:hypothetical protein
MPSRLSDYWFVHAREPVIFQDGTFILKSALYPAETPPLYQE